MNWRMMTDSLPQQGPSLQRRLQQFKILDMISWRVDLATKRIVWISPALSVAFTGTNRVSTPWLTERHPKPDIKRWLPDSEVFDFRIDRVPSTMQKQIRLTS